jgi:hypothetical protein
MSSHLNDINLTVPRHERRDHRDRHLRLDDDPQHGRDGRHVPLDRLSGVEGPLPRQPGRLGRAASIRSTSSARSAASPEHTVMSDGRLVVQSNNEGVPFVLASPEAGISKDIARLAAELVNAGRVAATAGRS